MLKPCGQRRTGRHLKIHQGEGHKGSLRPETHANTHKGGLRATHRHSMCHRSVRQKEAAETGGREESGPSLPSPGHYDRHEGGISVNLMRSSSVFSVVLPQEASLSSSSGPGPGETTADRHMDRCGDLSLPLLCPHALQMPGPTLQLVTLAGARVQRQWSESVRPEFLTLTLTVNSEPLSVHACVRA